MGITTLKVEKKWIGGQDGHWEVSNGIYKITCDDSELNETVHELEERGWNR